MNTLPTLSDWFDRLRILFPVAGLVQVGAGDGAASVALAERLAAARALFIEARPDPQEQLARRIEDRPGWTSVAAVVGRAPTRATFFTASNPDESGLLDPDALRPIWKNLASLQADPCDVVPLADLVGPVGDCNWLLVDCLPALPVLQGAGAVLDGLDVLIARALMHDIGPAGVEAGRDALDAWLGDRGFHPLPVLPQRHPGLGVALYVRDWRAAHDSLRTRSAGRIDDLRREQAGVLAQNEALTTQLETLTQEKAGLADRMTALAGEKAGLTTQVATLTEEKAGLAEKIVVLTEKNNGLGAANADLTARVASLTGEKAGLGDEVAALAAEKAGLTDKMTALVGEKADLAEANAALAAQVATLAGEKAGLDAAIAALAEEKAAQEAELTAARDDARKTGQELVRQQAAFELLRGEIAKAQSQLKLLQDVVCREKAR